MKIPDFIELDERLEKMLEKKWGKERFRQMLANASEMAGGLPEEVYIPFDELQKGSHPFVWTITMTPDDASLPEVVIEFFPYRNRNGEYGFHYRLAGSRTIVGDGNHYHKGAKP